MARYAAFDFAGLGMARRKDNSFTNEAWRAAAVVRVCGVRRNITKKQENGNHYRATHSRGRKSGRTVPERGENKPVPEAWLKRNNDRRKA